MAKEKVEAVSGKKPEEKGKDKTEEEPIVEKKDPVLLTLEGEIFCMLWVHSVNGSLVSPLASQSVSVHHQVSHSAGRRDIL